MSATQGWRHWLRAAVPLGLLACGVGSRLWWALTIAPRQGSDARMYLRLAAALADGRGYYADGGPSAYYPIGYSLALAVIQRVFGADDSVPRIANAVFALGTLAGLFGVTRAVTGSRVAASAALLLFAFYPADIGWTSVTLSQTFFNSLVLVGCALCLCAPPQAGRRALAAGVVLGCATLARHQGAVVCGLIVGSGLLLGRRQRRRQALLVAAAFVATLTPWTLRNARELGAFIPIATNGGIDLFIGNNPQANGRYKFTRQMEAQIAREVPRPWKGGYHEVLVERLAARLAFRYVSEHPRAALALWPRKLDHLFLSDDAFSVWSRHVSDDRQAAQLQRLKQLAFPYYKWLLALSAFGAVLAVFDLCARRKSWGSMLWLPAAVLIAFTSLHLMTFGDPSYHHPMMPWFTVYAGYACAFRGAWHVRWSAVSRDAAISVTPHRNCNPTCRVEPTEAGYVLADIQGRSAQRGAVPRSRTGSHATRPEVRARA